MVAHGHWTDLFSFVTGAIRERDLAYLVLSSDAAAKKKMPLSGFVQWEPEGWGDGGQQRWLTVGACIVHSPRTQLLAVGEQGQALLLGSGDRHEETIGAGKRSPKHRGPLRSVRTIGDAAYAVGMDRQVYRRCGENDWREVRGAPPSAKRGHVAGFNAIDGFGENELYAVGWDGEIWRGDARAWKQCDSPTGAVLTDVCCGGDGVVYACGRNGLLVRAGDARRWELINTGTEDDLWSVVFFEGKLYAASFGNVFVLEGKRLRPMNFGKHEPKTCGRLTSGAGMLWSIGAKDVLSFDGKKWSRID